MNPEKGDIKGSKKGVYLGNYAVKAPSPGIRGLQGIPTLTENTQPPSLKTPSKTPSNVFDLDARIVENFALQEMARKAVLTDYYSTPEEKRDKKPHRVCNCRRDLRPLLVGKTTSGQNQYEMSQPSLFKHKETGKVFLGGTLICGSPYACSMCAPKINEANALEIRNAVSQWVASGGICLFVTLTFPHQRSDSFVSLMKCFKSALRRFRRGRSFDSIKSELGYFSVIQSVEATWGDVNGWHPHSHEIWFVQPDFLLKAMDCLGLSLSEVTRMSKAAKEYFLDDMKLSIYNKWRLAVLASGLSEPSYQRGVNIQIAETEEEVQKRIAEYLTKTGVEKPPWGVDDELTRHTTKRGKPGRFTPFDFLRNQLNPEFSKDEKAQFLSLFAEYVKGMYRIRKIYWAPGLKAHFKIDEKTDEQKAEEQTEAADLFYDIPRPVWVFVIALQDHRAELVLTAQNDGIEAAKSFLIGLLDKYADYLGYRFSELSASSQYILESYNFNPEKG